MKMMNAQLLLVIIILVMMIEKCRLNGLKLIDILQLSLVDHNLQL